MQMEKAIRDCFSTLQNHRAVAQRLKLPLHVVMYSLGLMDKALFDRVNG